MGPGSWAVFTADDFGLAAAVNEAVELAHRNGLLTAASLMVAEPAAAEAVAIARRNPGLAVGLHLTLTNGTPMLPPAQIPALVGADGRLRDDMAGLGLRLAISADARRQLGAEITAQIAAFQATGLVCDHLNAHRHFHLHPVIAAVAFRAAAAAGIRTVRIPWEPPALVPGATRALWPMVAWLRRLAAQHGLWAPDRVVGLAWSGAFTAARLRAILPRLPAGVTELYFHPATSDAVAGGGPGYQHRAELAALLDPEAMALATRLRPAVQGAVAHW